jgi:hypothetical protein
LFMLTTMEDEEILALYYWNNTGLIYND